MLQAATHQRARLHLPNMATMLLAFSMFMTGACGLVAEYVMGTVATYILGNSIEQMSLTIAFMMLMMGVANFVQKHVSDDHLVEKFIGVEILLALTCSFGPIAMYGAFAALEDNFFAVQYLLIGTVGFLIGFELPLATRINEKHQAVLKNNIGSMFGWDYVGSFVGAIVWVTVLLPKTHIIQAGFSIALANFLVATVTFLYFRRQGLVQSRWLPALAIIATFVALSHGRGQVVVWENLLQQKLYDDPIIMSTTTRYQHVVVTHSKTPEDYRLYLNGNLQFSTQDEAVYHEHLVHPAMSLAASPRRVLILGGGDGMALREVLKHPSVTEVALVDLDPGMTALFTHDPLLRSLNGDAFKDARVSVLPAAGRQEEGRGQVYMETGRDVKTKNGIVPETERIASVTVYNLDATIFVRSIPGTWDVVIVDFPDPNAIELAKLFSEEFYRSLQGVLAQDGVAVVQSTSPYHAKETFLCILQTIRAAGWSAVPFHDNVPSFGDWGWVMLSREPEEELHRRMQEASFTVKTKYLTPDVFKAAMVFGKGRLESERDPAVSTLMHPVVLTNYVQDGWLNE